MRQHNMQYGTLPSYKEGSMYLYPQNQMIGAPPMIGQNFERSQIINEPPRMNPFQNQFKKVEQNKTNTEKNQVVVIEDDDAFINPQIPPFDYRRRDYQLPLPQVIPIQQPYSPYQFYPLQQPYYTPTMMFYQTPMVQPPPFQQFNFPQFQNLSHKTLDEPKLINQDPQKIQNFDSINQVPKPDEKNVKERQKRDILDIDVLEEKNLIYDPEIKKKPNNRRQTRRQSNDHKQNSSSYAYEEFTQRRRVQGRKKNKWSQKQNIQKKQLQVKKDKKIPINKLKVQKPLKETMLKIQLQENQ